MTSILTVQQLMSDRGQPSGSDWYMPSIDSQTVCDKYMVKSSPQYSVGDHYDDGGVVVMISSSRAIPINRVPNWLDGPQDD